MDISVIIVNYNVRDFLQNALLSLFKSLEGLQAEIFVVDNASDDGSVEFLKKSFSQVHLITNSTNVGFAKANNQALKIAQGKYFLLLNPDTLLQENTISTMIKFFEEHQEVGMAGCKILNSDGTLQLPCRRSFPTPWVAFTKIFGLSTLFPKSSLFAKYNITYKNPDECYEVDAISGSFMMLRKEVYEKIGGLDEEFFMYGEDLDWCYRVQKTGWKVYYVPFTSIIHYKGESTRRSNFDDIKIFYDAMFKFVKKNYRGSTIFIPVIKFGIFLRKTFAYWKYFHTPILFIVIDSVIIFSSILIAEYIRKGTIFSFPQYAYPLAFLVPIFTVIIILSLYGNYTTKRFSVKNSFYAVFSSYIIISALTAFFKEYAFSRTMVIISAMISTISIPASRIIARTFEKKSSRKTIFGKKTFIVGVDDSAQELAKKINPTISGYEVIGFISLTHENIGQRFDEIEVKGSIENLSKLIERHKITEVIFSSQNISYTTILSTMSEVKNKLVHFHLIPTVQDVIIGKTSVDSINEVPLVEIEYNIHKFSHRFFKRCFDIFASTLLLISFAPFVYFRKLINKKTSTIFSEIIQVFVGKMSIVGQSSKTYSYLGKVGILSLENLYHQKKLTESEKEEYALYYARHQSLLLDCEIIIKSLQGK